MFFPFSLLFTIDRLWVWHVQLSLTMLGYRVRGKPVLWLTVSMAIIILVTNISHHQSKQSEILQHPPPLMRGDVSGAYGYRSPSRPKQMSFKLDGDDYDMSYLENQFLEFTGSSSEDFDSEFFSDENVTFPEQNTNQKLTDFVVNKTTNVFQHGCYMRGAIKGIKKLLPVDVLSGLGCKQRPPEAIVFGVKKGGTTTLKEFLAFHPGVSVAPKELKFLSSSFLRKQGLEGYASLMPYSLPTQIPIEKTPGYMVRYRCIEPLKEMVPNCKLIAILSDPVKRAVSDFVHLSWVRDHREGGASELLPKHAHQVPHYEVKSTFEESVFYPNGSLKTWNTLLDTSLYYKHAKMWMGYFPPENFLFLDSSDLVYNPVRTFQEIEEFLGLPPFFSEHVFHFNETKGFYCVRYPIYSCMPPSKGRPHPIVDDRVVKKLQEYFEPYNKEFSHLINKTFSWTTYATDDE